MLEFLIVPKSLLLDLPLVLPARPFSGVLPVPPPDPCTCHTLVMRGLGQMTGAVPMRDPPELGVNTLAHDTHGVRKKKVDSPPLPPWCVNGFAPPLPMCCLVLLSGSCM